MSGEPDPGAELTPTPPAGAPHEVEIFDTTLRDGAQFEGISLTVDDKLRVAEQLDWLGVHWIEGGYPQANPKDEEFFRRAPSELRLANATLYCSLEPCFLCAGAILHTRVDRVVFGASDPKFGAVRSLANVLEDPRLNHRCTVVPGVEAAASAELLRAFFRHKRGG